jgi:Zn-dependent peptidase ImmA (M78 family)
MRLVLPPKVRTTKGDESITYWDDKLSPTKERFTIGHEVAHTFLFDRDKDTPTKVGWWVAAGIFDRRVEYFCDVYAAALLIPPIYVKIVASALAGHGPAIDTDTIIDHFGIPIKVLYWMVMSLSKTYWSIHHQHFLEFD